MTVGVPRWAKIDARQAYRLVGVAREIALNVSEDDAHVGLRPRPIARRRGDAHQIPHGAPSGDDREGPPFSPDEDQKQKRNRVRRLVEEQPDRGTRQDDTIAAEAVDRRQREE
jgi:hypothetical protein